MTLKWVTTYAYIVVTWSHWQRCYIGSIFLTTLVAKGQRFCLLFRRSWDHVCVWTVSCPINYNTGWTLIVVRALILELTTLTTFQSNNDRTQSSGWLSDNEYPELDKLSKYFDHVTGLQVSRRNPISLEVTRSFESERFQVREGQHVYVCLKCLYTLHNHNTQFYTFYIQF